MPFAGPNFLNVLDPGSVKYVVPSDVPVSLVFFVPYHQPVDLSATTPLPNAYYFAFCHPDSASKTRSLD
jgi:hypothetical protein